MSDFPNGWQAKEAAKLIKSMAELLGIEDAIPSKEEIETFLDNSGLVSKDEDANVTPPEPWPIFNGPYGAISNLIVEQENVVFDAKGAYADAVQDVKQTQNTKNVAGWQLQVEEERLAALQHAKLLLASEVKIECEHDWRPNLEHNQYDTCNKCGLFRKQSIPKPPYAQEQPPVVVAKPKEIQDLCSHKFLYYGYSGRDICQICGFTKEPQACEHSWKEYAPVHNGRVCSKCGILKIGKDDGNSHSHSLVGDKNSKYLADDDDSNLGGIRG